MTGLVFCSIMYPQACTGSYFPSQYTSCAMYTNMQKITKCKILSITTVPFYNNQDSCNNFENHFSLKLWNQFNYTRLHVIGRYVINFEAKLSKILTLAKSQKIHLHLHNLVYWMAANIQSSHNVPHLKHFSISLDKQAWKLPCPVLIVWNSKKGYNQNFSICKDL